eukprot:5397817-Pleurochrysis_carterae.AAC.2
MEARNLQHSDRRTHSWTAQWSSLDTASLVPETHLMPFLESLAWVPSRLPLWTYVLYAHAMRNSAVQRWRLDACWKTTVLLREANVKDDETREGDCDYPIVVALATREIYVTSRADCGTNLHGNPYIGHRMHFTLRITVSS